MKEVKIDRFCFVCDKQFTGAMDGNTKQRFTEPPSGGTCWTSHGNFGSTVYDSFSGDQYIELYICDVCLKKNSKRILEVRPVVERKYIVNGFDPNK